MGGLRLVIILASLHLGYTTPQNGINPGVGVETHVAAHTYTETGIYDNSSNRASVYELIRWEDGPSRVHLGVAAGMVTGYQWPVLPLVFPYTRIGLTDRVSVEIDVLPVSRPIVGMQLGIRLGGGK